MRFFYLRDENGHPIGRLASELDKATNTIKYAVSVCNPIDNFNKKQAQALAAGRIAMGDCYQFKLPETKGKTKQFMMEGIASKSEYPHRARNAAKLWLESHKEKQ
jgi:hypothetical protein